MAGSREPLGAGAGLGSLLRVEYFSSSSIRARASWVCHYLGVSPLGCVIGLGGIVLEYSEDKSKKEAELSLRWLLGWGTSPIQQDGG